MQRRRHVTWRYVIAVVLAGCAASAGSAAGVATVVAAAGAAVASPSAAAGTGPSGGAAFVSELPFSFLAEDFEVRELEPRDRPYGGQAVLPRRDSGPHDAQGVRMRRVRGRLYDFPRGQATYGLRNLGSYLATGDDFYLDRALAQARRLRDIHVAAGDAWYYPNAPSKGRHGIGEERIVAPYYGALAQGRVLHFLCRLAAVTGDAAWAGAAEHTFLSFLRPGPRPGPFVVSVDAHRYYWLQEWPWGDGLRPDYTFNGHNSAVYGLYEYYLLAHDTRALALFRGAATTTTHYVPAFRRPDWISYYCLEHRWMNARYHRLHVKQLLVLYRMTGAVAFARAADRLEDDFPNPRVTGRLHVLPGAYTALRFDAADHAISARSLVVRHTLTMTARLRQRHRGRGIFLLMTAGPAAGCWIAERPDRVYVRGVVVRHSYDPTRSIRLAPGSSYTAVRLGDDGRVVDRVHLQVEDAMVLAVNQRATVNGSPRARVCEGDLTGYWLRLGDGVRMF